MAKSRIWEPALPVEVVRHIRRLERQLSAYKAIAQLYNNDRHLMAKLAADGPSFYSFRLLTEAKARRNELLASQGLKPSGDPL